MSFAPTNTNTNADQMAKEAAQDTVTQPGTQPAGEAAEAKHKAQELLQKTEQVQQATGMSQSAIQGLRQQPDGPTVAMAGNMQRIRCWPR